MSRAKIHHPLLVAHRGDSRNFPENTLAAVKGAIALGVDVIAGLLRHLARPL